MWDISVTDTPELIAFFHDFTVLHFWFLGVVVFLLSLLVFFEIFKRW